MLDLKKKDILARMNVLHLIGQTYGNTGSVGKFSIYQFVERLTQRQWCYRACDIIPLYSGFSLNLYVW